MSERKALSSPEAAEYLGLSEATLRHKRSTGVANQPPYHKQGKRVVYYQEDLDNYLAGTRVDHSKAMDI